MQKDPYIDYYYTHHTMHKHTLCRSPKKRSEQCVIFHPFHLDNNHVTIIIIISININILGWNILNLKTKASPIVFRSSRARLIRVGREYRQRRTNPTLDNFMARGL